MFLFRGKNAKFTVMLVAIMLFIVLSYVAVMKEKQQKADEEEKPEKVTEAQQLIDLDLEDEYPQSVREVVKTYLKIMKQMYRKDSTTKEVEKLADQERLLLDDELTEANSYSTFLKNLKSEIYKYKKQKIRILAFDIEENNKVKNWTNEKRECASINAEIRMIKDNEPQVLVEQFVLRRDDKDNWKILGWEKNTSYESDSADKTNNTKGTTAQNNNSKNNKKSTTSSSSSKKTK